MNILDRARAALVQETAREQRETDERKKKRTKDAEKAVESFFGQKVTLPSDFNNWEFTIDSVQFKAVQNFNGIFSYFVKIYDPYPLYVDSRGPKWEKLYSFSDLVRISTTFTLYP